MALALSAAARADVLPGQECTAKEMPPLVLHAIPNKWLVCSKQDTTTWMGIDEAGGTG